MTNDPLRNGRWQALLWAGPLTLLLVLLWHSWQDPDVWYHLTLGRGVVEHLSFQPPDNVVLRQESYVNIYWLFQLIVWGAFRLAGVPGVTAVFLVAWCAAFGLWGACARLRAFPGAALALAAILICHPQFLERPEVFSYMILAGFLFRLSRADDARFVGAGELLLWAAAQAAWTNVHGYFFLGPAVALIWAASGTLEPRLRQGGFGKASNRWLLTGVLLTASLASPFGFGAWCERPTPARASAANSCGKESPPMTMPPILRKSRRVWPSQKAPLRWGRPKSVSIV